MPHCQCNKFHRYSRRVDGQRASHCKVRRPCRILSVMVPLRMCSWSDPGTLHGVLQWAKCPFLIQCHRPRSGRVGSPTITQKVKTKTTMTVSHKLTMTHLHAIARLCLLPGDFKNSVDKLGTFGVMAFSPVVTSTRLGVYEVVWSEQATYSTGTSRFHRTRFEVNKYGTRYVDIRSGFFVIDFSSF